MVIYKDKRFITNSEHPNDDFMGNADYVIPDGSEMAQKILALCPNFELIFDGDGNLVDVAETEPIITEEQINEYKNKRVTESKVKLAEWLATHPMQFTDGKYYSVTEEKQALLNGNLASYERAIQLGIEYQLKWNAMGSECELWNYNDLLMLSLSIAAYVAPKVAIQQSIEIAIKDCDTIEEIESIDINYD